MPTEHGPVGPPASPEDVRKRGLAVLLSSSTTMRKNGDGGDDTNDDGDSCNGQPSPSSPTRSPPMLRHLPKPCPTTIGGSWDLTEFQSIMWDTSGVTTVQDQQRWVNQGIAMRTKENVSSPMDDTSCTTLLENRPSIWSSGVVEQGENPTLPNVSLVHTVHAPEVAIFQNDAAAALGPSVSASSSPSKPLVEQLAVSHIPWGLIQQHGGPCGVLAALQAEMLRIIMYDDNNRAIKDQNMLNPKIALAYAMAEILIRVACTEPANKSIKDNAIVAVRIVVPNPNNPLWKQLLLTNRSDVVNVQVFLYEGSVNTTWEETNRKWEESIKAFVLEHLELFSGVGGVLLFVMSIVATRTIEIIVQEFDDPIGTKLTGQFGHCAQELINLLLTGQAVSNVFDNTLRPSGEIYCRGINFRPKIGYLSQLEALRYCEVGSYYKSPLVPIWVVGSTSHFTVLFGEDAALLESQSDRILEECRRAFKSMEGAEENGYIEVGDLEEVLWLLEIDLGGDAESVLASYLEVGVGAGIILWDDFWKVAGRLKTGATLESILGAGTPIDPIMVDEARSPSDFMETDAEMARRLNDEWSSNNGLSGLNALSSAAAVVSTVHDNNNDTMQVDPSPGMTDEEYARVLQASYDCSSNVSVGAVQGDTTIADDDFSNAGGDTSSFIEVGNALLLKTDDGAAPKTPINMEIDDMDSKPAAKRIHSFEEFGESFYLYHYNGLRGGVLTRFKVTRLSSQEAIGSSVALNQASGAGGSNSSSQDLEDVVRTKWPSCNVDWLGGRAPFID